MADDCPCGSGASYDACCRPFHDGAASPATAEALMRSRYSAYAKAEIAYLGDSLHPKKRKGHDPESTREWAEDSEWISLEIVSKEAGEEGDEEGHVEFIARYRPKKGEPVEHREAAEFRKQEGRWYFWDGRTIGPPPARRESPKVGRNDPCPCGSGKKHKKCCGTA